MHQLTKRGLKKWSIGAGCALTAALLFNQVKMNNSVALANPGALGESVAPPKSQTFSSQDQVMDEFGDFNKQHGRSNRSVPSIQEQQDTLTSPALHSKPRARTRRS